MIAANEAVFRILEDYCSRRGEPIPTAGQTRYISGDEVSRRHLQQAQLGPTLRFGRHRALTGVKLSGKQYIAAIGFEFESTLPLLSPADRSAGVTVCLLSELRPQPLATPAEIRNVVEFASQQDDPSYDGHQIAVVELLFPSIQLLQSFDSIDADSLWRLFLALCAEEGQQGASWIDQNLADALVALTDLNVPVLPYPALCRSMFDMDPRSLFMALYRCIEATYAYESCRKLVDRLSLRSSWLQLATALEDEVGWHPREADSLNLILRHAMQKDLEELCFCLNATPGGDIVATAGRAVYRLRNQIVHHRPGTEFHDLDGLDWNPLCRLMVHVVFSVFSQAYGDLQPVTSGAA